MSPALRVAVVGVTGSGKSTCAGLVEEYAAARGLSVARVKLAAPLYALQERVYETARVPLAAGAQDQVLMEALAVALRRIRPKALVDDFLDRLDRTRADVVVNDDLRDPHVDAPALRERGFRVLRVVADPAVRASRLAARADLSRADASTAELDDIEPDLVLDNSSDLADTRARVFAVLDRWATVSRLAAVPAEAP